MLPEAPILLPRAYYVAAVDEFLVATPETVLGTLTANCDFPVEPAQRNAWLDVIEILKTTLPGLAGTLFLEFNIPRMGRRIDAVLISGAVIFVIEFKVGESDFSRGDLDQVWDYALDLKNFHEASHGAPILPILVATGAATADLSLPPSHEDLVCPPVRSDTIGLRGIACMVIRWTVCAGDPRRTIRRLRSSRRRKLSMPIIRSTQSLGTMRALATCA
jgi:hypothetical protein